MGMYVLYGCVYVCVFECVWMNKNNRNKRISPAVIFILLKNIKAIKHFKAKEREIKIGKWDTVYGTHTRKIYIADSENFKLYFQSHFMFKWKFMMIVLFCFKLWL